MRLTPRRLVLMAVTALLSAELTAGWVLSQDPTYEGSVTVFLSQLFPRGTPVADIDPFAETFQLTMKAPDRTAEIARATGVSEADIRAKLSSSRGGQSPIVQVRYGPGEQGVVTGVAQQAAVLSMQVLAQAELDRAQARLDQARTAAEDGRQALSRFETESGLLDLDQAYEEQRAQLLEQIESSASQAAVQASQAELDRLAALRLERDELEGRLDSAVANIAAAESDRLGAESRLAAAASPSLVLTSAPAQTSRIPVLARSVIGSALVALAAWAAVFWLLDRRQRRRRPAGGRGEGGRGGDQRAVDADVARDGDLEPYVEDRVGTPVGAGRFGTTGFVDAPPDR